MAKYATVQHVEITIAAGATSGTATITSVTTTRASVHFGGFSTPEISGHQGWARVELTNATTVTAFRDTSDAGNAVIVRACVVEWDATVASVQHGTITLSSGNATNTAAITGVTTTRAAVVFLGFTSSNATAASNSSYASVDLTDTDTVTATRASTSGDVVLGFCVIEWASGITNSVQQRALTLTSNSTSSTDTISSVDTTRSVLMFGGIHSSVSAFVSALYRCAITANTTVTVTRTGTSTTSKTIRYTVVEFVAGVLASLERNSTAIASATSADTAVTAVDTASSALFVSGFSTTAGGADEAWASAKLLDTDTVRGQKGVAGTTTSTPAWEVVEFDDIAVNNVVGPGPQSPGNQFVGWHDGTIDPTLHKISEGIACNDNRIREAA